jgi:hypothetical protein
MDILDDIAAIAAGGQKKISLEDLIKVYEKVLRPSTKRRKSSLCFILVDISF